MRPLKELDKYRDILGEMQCWETSTDESRAMGGVFMIPTKGSRKGIKVIASSGDIPVSQGWEHVSASLPNRVPTWDEMCMLKDLFWYPHENCFQLHPAQAEHISNHKYCLHLWRNKFQEVPLPPSQMVGVKGLTNISQGSMSQKQVHAIQDKATEELLRGIESVPLKDNIHGYR